jgi:hypothetical protein
MLLREYQIAETAAHVVLSAAGIVSADGLLEQPAAVSCNYHSEQDFVITSEGGCRKYEICKAQVCGLQLLRACWLEASSTLRLPQCDVHASAVTAGAKPTGTGNRQAQRFHCSKFASRRMYHVHACVDIWVCANHAVVAPLHPHPSPGWWLCTCMTSCYVQRTSCCVCCRPGQRVSCCSATASATVLTRRPACSYCQPTTAGHRAPILAWTHSSSALCHQVRRISRKETKILHVIPAGSCAYSNSSTLVPYSAPPGQSSGSTRDTKESLGRLRPSKSTAQGIQIEHAPHG